MRRAPILASLLVLWATAAQAAGLSFGPIVPGVSVDGAMAALPGATWNVARDRSGKVVGAYAENALRFAGRDWHLRIGDIDRTLGGTLGITHYDLSLFWDGPTSDADCRAVHAEAVAAMEPALGAFGTDPQFADPHSPLYDDVYRGFVLVPIAGKSIARVWSHDGLNMHSFRESDAGFAYTVGVYAATYSGDETCEVRIEVFQDPDRDRRRNKRP